MKAYLNPDLCTGCTICEVVCPEVFRMNENGGRPVAVVHTEEVPEEAMSFCRDARDCCRPRAIDLHEEPARTSLLGA